MQAAPPPTLSPLLRRALSLAYEALLLAALLWCAALLFRIIETPLAVAHSRTIFQAYLFLLTSGYFVWQWTHGGQTLAMKAWRIRLVTPRGDAINARQAWTRYLLATFSLGAFGLGFVWALIDRERQFLHDRLAGTRLVSCQRLAPLQTQHQDDRKPEE